MMTEINRGPAILEALAECRYLAAQAEAWREDSRTRRWRKKREMSAFLADGHEEMLRDALLDLGNLMVGR